MRVRTKDIVKTKKDGKIARHSPLQYPQLNKTVKGVNTLMQSLKDKIDDLKIPDFGSSLYSDDSHYCVLHDSNTIIASVIADRISGKFEKPDKSTESGLKRQCSTDWIDYERDHLAKAKWVNIPLEGRSKIVRAREYAHAWLNGSKGPCQVKRYDRSFWYFASKAPIEFGPGESFISRQGDVSLFSKLDPYYATVTLELAPIAARFISINKGLREIFNEAFQRDVGPSLPDIDPDFIGPLEKRFSVNESSRSFQYRVRAWWDKHNLIQRGSRGSSVYKNTKKRRFINIECLLNVVIQKIFGWSLRQCLKVNGGCDLDLGQDKHKHLIRYKHLATVDWSNASDSIVTWAVQQLLLKDQKIFKALDLARSQFVLIDTPVIDCQRTVKQYHSPLKFSSMGNGFTFELLTLVNLAVSRVFDKESSVYGDDVIIANEHATIFINTMKQLGFMPNLKKSFINKPLRESCGGFFLEGTGYIRSYDFKWNFNIADCITTANKLSRILRLNKTWNHRLRDLIEQTHSEVCNLIHPVFQGPESDDLVNIPQWCESRSSNIRRVHTKVDLCKENYRKYSKPLELYSSMYQRNVRDFIVVLVPQVVDTIRLAKQRHVYSKRLLYTYIHQGRSSAMLMRTQKEDYRIGFKPVLVHFIEDPSKENRYCDVIGIRAATARRITQVL